MAAPPVLCRFIAAERVQWWEPGGAVNEGDLNGLAGAAWERRLVLVVPGEFCLLSRVTLPVKQPRAFMQALPYALEEQLAEDVEGLHFAVGPQDDGATPVVVMNRQVLASWLARCAAHRIQVQQVLPDPLTLPWSPGDWSVLLEPERAVLRSSEYEGFACERENLPVLLELSLARTPEPPARLRVWGEANELAILPMVQEGSGRVSVMGTGLAELNLLQGVFSPSAGLQKWLRPWRGVAVLVVLAGLLQLATVAVESWQLTQEQQRLRAEQLRLFQQAVPGVNRIVNPRVQLQNRLAELSRGDDAADFLSLLQKTAEVLIEVPELRLEGLRFQAGRLELQLEGSDLNRFDALRQGLEARGDLQVQMRTTRREERAVSRVSVQSREGA